MKLKNNTSIGLLMFAMLVSNPSLLLAANKQSPVAATELDQPAVELKDNGVVIYPQRMDLQGEENLLDMLQLYPGLSRSGYDDAIDGFQLNIEGNQIFGNMRNKLIKTMARDVESICIVDNPGVQYGMAGMKGIILVTLVKKDGLSGRAGVDLQSAGPGAPYSSASAATVLPSATIRFRKGETEVLTMIDYGHSETYGLRKDTESAFLNFKFKPSQRDASSFIGAQQFSQAFNSLSSSYQRTAYALFCNTHQFNSKGLNLYTELCYLRSSSPLTAYVEQIGHQMGLRTYADIPVGTAILHVPIPIKGMNGKLGYQYNYISYDYYINTMGEMPEGTPEIPEKGRFTVNINQVFAMWNYDLPKWKFALGVRNVLMDYKSVTHVAPDKKRHESQWMYNASAVYVPSYKHQVQLSYNRKYINPSYANFNMRDILMNGINMSAVNLNDDKFNATLVEQVKLAYRMQLGKWHLLSAAGFTHLDGYVQYVGVPTQWLKSDTWHGEFVGSWNSKWFGFTADAGIYSNEYRTDDASETVHSPYATFRLAPIVFLPGKMQVRAQAVFFTKEAPLRMATGNAVYGSLQLNKQIGKCLDLYAQWHDIFYGTHSYVMGGVNVIF